MALRTFAPAVGRVARAVRHPRRLARGLRRRVRAVLPARPVGVAPRARSTSGGRGAAGAPAPPGDDLGDRLVRASATLVEIRDRPVLAVVAGHDGASAWSTDAHVQLLRPNDALTVLAIGCPDVLVVRGDAGRSGSWLGTGTYQRPERDRTILDLVRAARDKGIHTVLCSSAEDGATPMLTDLAPEFDLVAPLDAPVHALLPRAAPVSS